MIDIYFATLTPSMKLADGIATLLHIRNDSSIFIKWFKKLHITKDKVDHIYTCRFFFFLKSSCKNPPQHAFSHKI